MADPQLQLRFEAALTEEAYSAAWRYSWRLARSRDDAEDLLQESLAQAWRQFGQLREATQFKPWLLAIVRRQFLSRLRIAQRRPRVVAEVPAQLAGPEPDPEFARVKVALSRLKPDEQELLLLVYCEGLSLAEAGQVLGHSARAVRQRLYRARLALREACLRSLVVDMPLRSSAPSVTAAEPLPRRSVS
jgi:RNA polymerase sigma factor (sigma-70 family)